MIRADPKSMTCTALLRSVKEFTETSDVSAKDVLELMLVGGTAVGGMEGVCLGPIGGGVAWGQHCTRHAHP